MTTALIIVGCVALAVPLLVSTVLLIVVAFTRTPEAVSRESADKEFRRAFAADELRVDIRDHTVLIMACGFGSALLIEVIPRLFLQAAEWFGPIGGTDVDAVFSVILTVSAVTLAIASAWTVLLLPPILSQLSTLHQCRVPEEALDAAERRAIERLEREATSGGVL